MTVPELTSPVVVLGEYSFSKTRPSPQLRKRLTRPNLVVAGIGGSGKSLVLRRMLALHKTGIQDPHVDADVVPSVGVDINTFPIDKKRNMVCKEVGGTMMPLWPMYMKDCAGLVYVVDASDSLPGRGLRRPSQSGALTQAAAGIALPFGPPRIYH